MTSHLTVDPGGEYAAYMVRRRERSVVDQFLAVVRLEDGGELARIKEKGTPGTCRFLAGGRHLVWSLAGATLLIEVGSDGLTVARRLEGPCGQLGAAEERPRFAVGGDRGDTRRISIWSGPNAAKLADVVYDQPVTVVEISPDGSRVVSGTKYLPNTPGRIRFSEADTGRTVAEYVGPSSSVTALAFIQRGDKLVVGYRDGATRLLDCDGTELARPTESGGSIRDISVSPDGEHLAILRRDHPDNHPNIDIFELETGAHIAQLHDDEPVPVASFEIWYHPELDKRIVFVDRYAGLSIWDYRQGWLERL